VSQGDEVSVHYDPMIAKLVVWSQDRSSALRKLRSCLSEYNIVGLNTNVDFLMQLSAHEKFVEGDVHTDFIDQHYNELFPNNSVSDQLVTQAVLASLLNEIQACSNRQKSCSDQFNPFAAYPMMRLNQSFQRNLKIKCKDSTFDVQLTCSDGGKYKIKIGDGTELDVTAKLSVTDNVNHIELTADGQISKSRVVFMDEDIFIFTKDGSCCFSMEKPAFLTSQSGATSGAGGAVAPMPGIIEKILVQDGEEVVKGQPLLVMIAMKMEYVIRAPEAGIVKKVSYRVGDSVAKNAALVQFELAVEN